MKSKYRVKKGIYEDFEFIGEEINGRIHDVNTVGTSYSIESCIKLPDAQKITIEIFRIILQESNGLTQKEIIEKRLAEDCISSHFFQKIERLIKHSV